MKNQDLQLVNFEQAERLDAVGFDWQTRMRYDYSCQRITETSTDRNHNDKNKWTNKDKQGCSAPTVALALKWMRDVKGARIGFSYGHYRESNIHAMGYAASGFLGDGTGKIIERKISWESAESALLDELLTLLETK